MTTKLTISEKVKAKQAEKKKLAAHIAVDYPEAKWLSTNSILRYKAALDAYPDLAGLNNTRLILLAYDFRQEQIRSYRTQHMTELADARCDVQLGGYRQENIPKDLPALSFEKDCIICREQKKGVSLCPECWQLIRNRLEIKMSEVTEKARTKSLGVESPLVSVTTDTLPETSVEPVDEKDSFM